MWNLIIPRNPMSSALSNALASCQKKTSDIALSILRATSPASTKVAVVAPKNRYAVFLRSVQDSH